VSQGSTHHIFQAVWKRTVLGGTCPPPGDFAVADWCYTCYDVDEGLCFFLLRVLNMM